MILLINTTDLEKVELALIGEKVLTTTFKLPYHDNHKILEHIEKFLRVSRLKAHGGRKGKKEKKSVSSVPHNLYPVTSIVFVSGKGSYTGIRIAASIAQAISLVTKIPVRTMELDKLPKNLKSLVNKSAS